MSLLDEARKPQERKQADVTIGRSGHDTKGDAYEGVCTGITFKPSDFKSPTGEEVINIYVAADMDDGRTLLVCGQTKILREELAAAIAAGSLKQGTRFAVAYHGEGPKKPGRKPTQYHRLLVDAPPTAGTAQAENTNEIPDEPPF